MKKINEQKLQAFTAGSMGKRVMSRKEIEEQKKLEEEAAAAHAFKEFVETFQGAPSKISKVWVKAGTYDAGSRKEDNKDKGKLYKPQSKIDSEAYQSSEYVRMLASENKKDSAALKKKNHEKKKSNLELFKEELRQIQEEREERHKHKSMSRTMQPITTTIVTEPDPILKEVDLGSFDNGDPNTTNVYLGNLNPKISEQQLMELFGKFGPLASIKIMWPRSEEEKSRGRNCGFVAYMSRRDAERALKALNGKDVMSYEMKLGWGKSVPIMSHPIYIPPALVEYALPPPPSGLPFNAQPHPYDADHIPKMTSKMYMNDLEIKDKMDRILFKAIIKVVIPTERPLLMLIHRTIEFVIREGPMFEALIMTREMENPMFKFLFENESPAHIYYRWKLFSLLQGDSPSEWRLNEFRMFKGGSIWKPPPTNFYSQGMPEELITDEDASDPHKGALSVAQRDRLEDLLRKLTPERQKIGDAMIFCIEHADAADEICECISESLASNETLVYKKIARIYLVSDILHNCSVKIQNASFYRKSMEKNLLDMFKSLNSYYMSLESRLKAEGFKARVMQIMKAWEEWTVYPRDFLSKLKNTFLGLPVQSAKQDDEMDEEKEDEDLDGVPLDGAALLKGAMLRGITENNSRSPPRMDHMSEPDEDDIDGMPFDEDIDGIPMDLYQKSNTGSFVPSKWETVDANQIEAQAITSSKWETLDPIAPEPPNISKITENSSGSDDFHETNSRDIDEERRLRLREIEVKLMQFQDEIESGVRAIKPGLSLSEQVELYRKKLIKKSERELRQDSDSASEAPAPSSSSSRKSLKRSVSPVEISKKYKKNKYSPSPEYTRSSPLRSSKASRRSRSPYIKTRRPSISASPARSKPSKRKTSRSRSPSCSPKRYALEKSLSPVRTSKYADASPLRSSSKYDKYDTPKYESNFKYESTSKYDTSSPRRYRSPSPKARNLSPPASRSNRSSQRTTREPSPTYRYHRDSSRSSDKHKKHKY